MIDEATVNLLVKQNQERRRLSNPAAETVAIIEADLVAILDVRDIPGLDYAEWRATGSPRVLVTP